MKVVTTKDELRNALRQKDESIIIKGDLAIAMKRMLRTSIIISVTFAVAMLVVMCFIGWSSEAGRTVRFVIHIAATLALWSACLLLASRCVNGTRMVALET